MYFNNGDVCSIHGHSTSTTHYVGGYVQEAAGDLRHVIWTDLSLEDLDQLPTRGNNLLTKFIAGWRKYEVWQRLGDSVTYYTGDPWTLGHTLHLTSVASNHSHGWGVTLLSQRCVPAFPCLPQGEYEVPPGVVVTVAAWRLQLKTYPDLQQAVRAVQQAVGTAQPAHIRDTCARAVEVCRGLEICPPVAEALQDALLKHLQHSCRVAVRSSGCAEDGQETSAAGQNETVLGVSGVPQVLAALAQCWASSFTFHSVEYRRQHGQGVEAGMGVVVQQMVEAEVAGVMFTIDPVTVNPAYIVITANYGLGESVVSAVVDSDTIVVRRSWRDQLSLVHTKLGAKKIKYTIKEEGGPVKEEVSEEERRKVCLSETTALRLAGLAVYLHQAFATHRDIEFALVQERVYLLQARPVTGLQVWTDYEVTHEHDTAIITDHELLTKANTGEVFPGSASPLTLSLIPQCIDLTFQKELSRIKWPFYTPEPQHVRLSPSYYSHVFLNMLEMQFRDNEEKMTAANRAMDLAIYGHIVSTDEYLAWGKERFGLASIFNRWIYLIFLVYDKLSNTRRVRRSQQMFGDYDLGCAWMDSAATLYQEITRNLPDLLQVSKTHIITSKVSSSTQCIALLLLAEGKEFSEENIADMALLLSTCAQVESADVPTALKELARVIGENEEAEEFLSITSEEGQVWLESHPGIVGDTYRSFLARHGHRCIKELDLSSLSWGLDPRPLVYTLQVMVSHPTSYKTTKTVVNVEDTLQRLQTHPSKNTRRALQWMLPLCREAVVHREATKSHVVKVLDGFRRAYRVLTAFILLLFVILNHFSSLRAMRRRRLHCHLDNLKFPEISIGIPQPVTPLTPNEIKMKGSGQVIVGTPVCHGVVTAPARVVTSLHEATEIQNGDILVTVSTDVGWTPYFPLLAGVITEIGGLISHGRNTQSAISVPLASPVF
nr:prodigiosin synthesizing transferase PigC-like [Cherax quadricarinatus]